MLTRSSFSASLLLLLLAGVFAIEENNLDGPPTYPLGRIYTKYNPQIQAHWWGTNESYEPRGNGWPLDHTDSGIRVFTAGQVNFQWTGNTPLINGPCPDLKKLIPLFVYQAPNGTVLFATVKSLLPAVNYTAGYVANSAGVCGTNTKLVLLQRTSPTYDYIYVNNANELNATVTNNPGYTLPLNINPVAFTWTEESNSITAALINTVSGVLASLAPTVQTVLGSLG